MPRASAIEQFRDQLFGGDIARRGVQGLESAGLGALRPKQFFRTPFDEQLLRQQLMSQILGGLGFGAYPGAQDLFGGGFEFDPFSGGLRTNPFDKTSDIIPPGPPQLGGDMITPQPLGSDVQVGPFRGRNPFQRQRGEISISDELPSTFPVSGGGLYRPPSIEDLFSQFGARIPATPETQSQLPVGANPLGVSQARTAEGSFPAIAFSAPTESVINPGAAGLSPTGQGGFAPWQLGMAGLPDIDPATRNILDQLTQNQITQTDLDFQTQRQALLNDLFGRGMNASTIATDAGGRLLYGRQQIMSDILAQRAERELQMRQQAKADLMKQGAGRLGGGFGGGSGGSLTGFAGDTSSLDALSFEQKLALQELGLKQQQLAQEGALGGRELDIRQLLGMGELGLGRSGQQQDLLRFLMGQGLERQRLAGGLAQGEMGRMTDYISGLGQLGGSLAQSQAQIDAQRRSMLSRILGGAASLGGSLLGGSFGGRLGDWLFGGGKP